MRLGFNFTSELLNIEIDMQELTFQPQCHLFIAENEISACETHMFKRIPAGYS